MRGLGMIQLRLSGESGVIEAIYLGLKETIPRGPRGGALYRLSLRENTDNVSSRLYTDLPPAIFADLFQGAAAARRQDSAYPVPTTPGVATLIRPVHDLPKLRYHIGYKAQHEPPPQEDAP